MFYYRNWDRFCKFLIQSGLAPCTAEGSITLPQNKRFVVLKHDVETAVPAAHRLASIEKQNGICGSYYVQAYLLDNPDNIRLLQEMRDWGHEISYHYDVLDACNGNYEEAEAQFYKYLEVFKKNGFQFRTICQHGNPVKQRVGYNSNRDFFRNVEIHKKYAYLIDMVVDYSHYITRPYLYISDAGYRWNVITEPETNDLHPEVKNVKIGGFENLMKLVGDSDYCFVISTHPHRWMTKAWKIYLKICFFRFVRNTMMFVQHFPGIGRLMNKFYYLAKKI